MFFFRKEYIVSDYNVSNKHLNVNAFISKMRNSILNYRMSYVNFATVVAQEISLTTLTVIGNIRHEAEHYLR